MYTRPREKSNAPEKLTLYRLTNQGNTETQDLSEQHNGRRSNQRELHPDQAQGDLPAIREPRTTRRGGPSRAGPGQDVGEDPVPQRAAPGQKEQPTLRYPTGGTGQSPSPFSPWTVPSGNPTGAAKQKEKYENAKIFTKI